MSFAQMVTGSILVRFMAIIVLFLIMLASIAVATVDLLINRSVPSIVCTVLGFGVGTAGTLIGINFGVVLQPAPPPPDASNSTSATITVNNPPAC
jgi:hypothetical protein